MRYQIIHGDCFEWLAKQPENSFQAVITDPPFGLVEYSEKELKKMRKGRGGVWRIPPSIGGSLRKPLPHFTVLSRQDMEQLREYFHKWGRLILRVLTPGGHLVIASNPLLSPFLSYGLIAAGFERRGEIIRLVRTLRGGDRPKLAEEEFPNVSVMPRSCYEPWGLFRKPLRERSVAENLRKWATGGLRRTPDDRPFPDVLKSEFPSEEEERIAPHPSLKPQRFLRQLVWGALPLGKGTIVDPFMGSGSTLAAAEALGYPSVGIEIDPEFVEMAKRAVPTLAGLEVEWQSFEGANGNGMAEKEAEEMPLDYKQLRSERQGEGECLEEPSGRYGTFQDCLQAPIHQWFQYPAGFSYKLIESKIQEHRLDSRHWILDPFVGCGTTLVAAKLQGVNAVGIEAHPFVHWVAKVKCYWEYHLPALERMVNSFCHAVDEALTSGTIDHTDINEFPELVGKCYSPQNLARLRWIRDAIDTLGADKPAKDFLRLALTATLRNAAKAGTGWPYIAPTKYHEKSVEREACTEFKLQARRMLRDLYLVTAGSRWRKATITLILGDARLPHPEVKEESVDLAITSPPYLNNYDYADRTRLEMYFFGWAKSWSDITRSVRDKLILAATTQIRRSAFPSRAPDALEKSLRDAHRKVYDNLRDAVAQLEQIRLRKGGKKSYDIMVAGYFNDMFKVLCQVYKAMKPGAEFVLVLGDSAPYGVYIPTEEYLGKLGVGIGFSSYKVEMLRKRGDKWAHNSQRHHVALKESILTLLK